MKMLRTSHPMRFEKGAIPLGKYQFARLTRQVFFLRRQCLAYGEGDHLRLLLLKHQLLILNRSGYVRWFAVHN